MKVERVADGLGVGCKIRKESRPCQDFGQGHGKDSWRGIFEGESGFPSSSAGKESACNVGDLGSIPGLGKFPGEGKGYPLQYSSLENSADCILHGVTKSRT